MNHDRAIAEESTDAAQSRCVWIDIGCSERITGDLAIFAREVANLACCWLGSITDRVFATDVRVKMGECAGTTAGGVNRLNVEMVD